MEWRETASFSSPDEEDEESGNNSLGVRVKRSWFSFTWIGLGCGLPRLRDDNRSSFSSMRKF